MKRVSRATLENTKIAWKSIRSQFLRTVLTILIIALGITTLIAINTISEALKNQINGQFAKMGSNTLVITKNNQGNNFQSRGKRSKYHPPITYQQAQKFKKDFSYEAITSMSALGSMTSVVKFESKKSNPNVKVLGCDNEYMELNSLNIKNGRNFTENEISLGSNVVIIGTDIVKAVFKGKKDIIGQVISIGAHKYSVVGILASQGSTFGMSNDNQCLIPLMNLKKKFASTSTSYMLNVKVNDLNKIDEAYGEAYQILRAIRKDKLTEEESFKIQKSEQLSNEMTEGIGDISFYISIIGYITLLGAGIGLMNIMLVSVTERTREIGIRKAIGASAGRIRSQFLLEAVLIGQIGGIVGIIFGILVGNVIAYFMEIDFIMPWFWIITGFLLCFMTSVISGYLPASKASKLDPIEALRHS